MPPPQTARAYPFRVLTGKERLELHSHHRRIPISLMLAPLRNGSPIFVQGLRRSSAHYLRKRLGVLLKAEVDAIHVVVDGIDGYTYSIHVDVPDVVDAPDPPLSPHSR